MIELAWLTDVVLGYVQKYGLFAVFLFMVLETSLLFPFVPSELVVPSAAVLLVSTPISFATFVGVATVGATVGSVLAYYLFGKNGQYVLTHYGRYIRLSRREIDQGQRWFRRWGESAVFWGRLLPILRSLISVPAGMSDMDVRRFVFYSAAGTLCFVAATTYLTLVSVDLLVARVS